jgi:SH3-like domain-containing protein
VSLAFRALIAFLLLGTAAQAAEKNEPLPRFASLRADTVNLRTGPGSRYPIEWVYRKKGYPVEIIAERDQWRQVRDWQGTEGWVQQRMVTGLRSVVIKGAQRTMRADASATAAPIAKLDPGVIAKLVECRDTFCRIELPNGKDVVKGWLARTDIWGVYPNEVLK